MFSRCNLLQPRSQPRSSAWTWSRQSWCRRLASCSTPLTRTPSETQCWSADEHKPLLAHTPRLQSPMGWGLASLGAKSLSTRNLGDLRASSEWTLQCDRGPHPAWRRSHCCWESLTEPRRGLGWPVSGLGTPWPHPESGFEKNWRHFHPVGCNKAKNHYLGRMFRFLDWLDGIGDILGAFACDVAVGTAVEDLIDCEVLLIGEQNNRHLFLQNGQNCFGTNKPQGLQTVG